MDLSIFCLLPIILIVSFHSGEGLECYSCNSGSIYEGEKCTAVAPGSTNFIQNCTKQGLEDGKDYQRCRIMVQDVEGDVRIVRSCATWPDKSKQNRCVDRTGTSKIKVRYCECEGDKCNGSLRINSSALTLLAAVVGLLFASSVSR